MKIKVDSQLKHIEGKETVDIRTVCGERKRGNGWRKIPGCIMVRSFDFIGTTAALWKDIRFTSERHLDYTILSEGKM